MFNQTEKYINNLLSKSTVSKPFIFDLNEEDQINKVNELFAKGKIQYVVDDYEEQQRELFAANNPMLVYGGNFEDEFNRYYHLLDKTIPILKQGNWVYLPWLSKLIHILAEDHFQLVRTARNKNLINVEEQKHFYNAVVGIAGLSVGSSVAYSIVLQGGAKHLKLADMDKLALSNTNRILSGVDSLGTLKVEMAARKIYEMNPYAIVEVFPEGLTKDNIATFFSGLDIVIDEIDNLSVKYLIREQAQKNKIAVVMAADNGDNAVVDIDRYDIDQNTPFFHNRMGDVSYDSLLSLDKFGIGKMITKLVGPENVTERMQQSLLEMGKTIVSWPQLGGAAMINGAAVAYCVRKILNSQPLESNRSLIMLDEKLVPDYNTAKEKERREKVATDFKKIFGL